MYNRFRKRTQRCLPPPEADKDPPDDSKFLLQEDVEEELEPGIQFKGTVSPDYKCLEVISIKSPLLGHVTPDI